MRKGGRALAGVSLALFFACGAAWAEAEPRETGSLPLETESVTCVGKNTLLVQTFVEFLETPSVPYRYFEGYMLAGPVVSARFGIAENVEIGASGAVHLWAFPVEGRDRNEFGDFSIWTKWAALQGKGKRPALGLYWGAKLPNASDETGLGTDHSDIFAQIIASRQIAKRYRADLNLGLTILGDPTKAREQNDVFTYALAVTRVMGERTSAMAEIEGHSGKGHAPTECNLRAGVLRRGKKRYHYFAAVSAGLSDHSPDWGARVGMGASFGGKKKAD